MPLSANGLMISSTNSKVIFLSNFLIIQFWKQKKRLQKIKKDRTPPNKEPNQLY